MKLTVPDLEQVHADGTLNQLNHNAGLRLSQVERDNQVMQWMVMTEPFPEHHPGSSPSLSPTYPNEISAEITLATNDQKLLAVQRQSDNLEALVQGILADRFSKLQKDVNGDLVKNMNTDPPAPDMPASLTAVCAIVYLKTMSLKLTSDTGTAN
jgi:hypothetical protein